MKKPTKLRPRTLDITFCKSATRACAKCATCSRNSLRYDLSGFTRLSFFASPIIQPHKPCDYYLHDDRTEKGATPTTKNSEKCEKDEQ